MELRFKVRLNHLHRPGEFGEGEAGRAAKKRRAIAAGLFFAIIVGCRDFFICTLIVLATWKEGSC